jgi:hypothetical protein
MARLSGNFLIGGIMQIVLNDKERELLQDIDTSKFGWGNDKRLKDNPKFKALAEYDFKEITGNGKQG